MRSPRLIRETRRSVRKDPDQHWLVARSLAADGDPRAVPLLVDDILGAPPAERRTRSAWLVVAMGSPAVAPLVQLLGGPAEEVARELLTGLGAVAVPEVSAALEDGRRRVPATQVLGSIDDEGVVAPLISQAEGGRPQVVRLIAIDALGHLRAEAAVEPLMRLLGGDDEHVRAHAADALGRLGDERAVGPLCACLGDQREHVRGAAVQALSRLRDERAVPALLKVLQAADDENVEPAGAAAQALAAHGDAGTQALLTAVDSGGNPWAARAALGALQPDPPAFLTDERVIRRVARVLPDPEIGRTAAETLAFAGEHLAPDLVFPLLFDPDAGVRANAVRALATHPAPRVVDQMIELMRSDPHQMVREWAAWSLSNSPGARDALSLTASRDPDAGVRRVAAASLEQLAAEPA